MSAFGLCGCGKSRDNTYAHIRVMSSGEHVWCEGAIVTQGDDKNDVRYIDLWSDMDCRPSGKASASCDVVIPRNRALLFQCYVQRDGRLIYACDDRKVVKLDVSETYRLVSNGQGGQLCQID